MLCLFLTNYSCCITAIGVTRFCFYLSDILCRGYTYIQQYIAEKISQWLITTMTNLTGVATKLPTFRSKNERYNRSVSYKRSINVSICTANHTDSSFAGIGESKSSGEHVTRSISNQGHDDSDCIGSSGNCVKN